MLIHPQYPRAAVYGYVEGESMFFIVPDGMVEITGVNHALGQLLRLCTGERTTNMIVEEMSASYDASSIQQLIDDLFQQHVLVDSRHVFLDFHEYSVNPMRFMYDISDADMAHLAAEPERPVYSHHPAFPLESDWTSPLTDLLNKRISVRRFCSQCSPTLKEVSSVLLATYGCAHDTSHASVPSGGALYPLRQYCFLLKEISGLQAGLYYVDGFGRELVQLQTGDFSEQLANCFINGHDLLAGATMVQVLSAYFERSAQKYANRAYRYILLEAGHAAQNAYLSAADQGLGIVEIGGFFDVSLGQLCGVRDGEWVVTTLISGVPDDHEHTVVS